MSTTPDTQHPPSSSPHSANANQPISHTGPSRTPEGATAQGANGDDPSESGASAISSDTERLPCEPEQIPLVIQMIRSGKDPDTIIGSVLGDDARSSIDALDKALDGPDLPLPTRKKYLQVLYKMCGHHALLPSTMYITVPDGTAGAPLFRGGFSDVRKGQYHGRDVAVKIMRTYSNVSLQKIIGIFCKEVVVWKTLRHPNVLQLIGVMISENQFAMISDWMANGNISDFVKAHPEVNRITLLQGVAKGLIYIHDQGMTHGDLKSVNILIDQTGTARLVDFGLLTIISDPTNLLASSSNDQSGTARWMSPELIYPEQFKLKYRPTTASDCYALGMVIYETISGRLPFHEHAGLAVAMKVLNGERPRRGRDFTDDLWKMLKLCWKPELNDRPSVTDVLLCLERASNPSEPASASPPADEGPDDGDDDCGSTPCLVTETRSESPVTPRRNSDRRPRTPDEGEDPNPKTFRESLHARRPRNKRVTSTKGWNSWADGLVHCSPPSEMLVAVGGV